MPLSLRDTHTVRGPRQAGKTTLAKRLIRRLLRAGEPRVLYFSFDLHVSPDAAVDEGGLGSLHLPVSFRDFARQVEGIPLPDETATVEGFLTEQGGRLARRINLLAEDLDRAYRSYLEVGGYPAAIRDYRTAGARRPNETTIRMLWSVIAGDIAGSRRDQVAAAKLLEEVSISLGSPLKWSGAARAMGMSNPVTARDYVEFLSASFSLLTVFFWDTSGGTLQPGKQRKVYFMDPLLASVAPLLMPGARRPPADAMHENAAAIGLFRSAASVLTQADAAPGAVGYWRSSNNREIDFVVPAQNAGGRRIPVEIKGDADSGLGHARLAIRKAFGRGIVASRSVFDLEGPAPVMPLPVLLGGLTESPLRTGV